VVYAGAIMVLFLFVIMLLNVKREEARPGESGFLKLAGSALAAILVLETASVFLRAQLTAVPSYDASTAKVAALLFSPHFLYVFEATSILILAALVGAVALAKKDL
jgi:NADH-quinone oxidoreductase subunit J